MMDQENHPDQDLAELRRRIDALDLEILEKLNQRAEYSLTVAAVKQQTTGAGVSPIYYRPEREAQVLHNIVRKNPGPLNNEKVMQVYRQIMSACLALEEPLKIAYLGPEGTFTQLATLKQFGHAVLGVPTVTVDDVFREVASENCHYGVVPVENSAEGVIHHTLDNFLSSSLHICGEVELRIHHHLMVNAALHTADIEKIYAHYQTFAQCRRWLDGHHPRLAQITTTSNAEAAQKALHERGTAAIASEIAAEIYGLQILAKKIEDQPENTTRFIVVGREAVGISGKDKTSIMVSTHNQPGALYQILEPFHRHGISLTSIETRSSKTGMWSYVFFIDFEGHRDAATIRRVMAEMDQDALEIKILGSYPKAMRVV